MSRCFKVVDSMALEVATTAYVAADYADPEILLMIAFLALQSRG